MKNYCNTRKTKHKYFVNAGVYVLDPKCINLIPKNILICHLYSKMILKNKKIISFPLGEYWLDIGKFNDYKKANIEFDFFLTIGLYL